jgi:hypothetical protein
VPRLTASEFDVGHQPGSGNFQVEVGPGRVVLFLLALGSVGAVGASSRNAAAQWSRQAARRAERTR